MTDEGRVKKIARQLCRAAGKDPDKTVRIGAPFTLNVGGCHVIKVLMLPAWREHTRDARRMSGEL
jgi:hypothetical protein